MTDENSLGAVLHEMRERKNISRPVLGAVLGVSEKTLKRWEEGTHKAPKGAVERAIEVVENWETSMRDRTSADPSDSLVYIPLMAPRLAAGSGEVVLSEEAEKVYGFRREWVSRIGSARAMRLFRVRGDSMRPTVLDKDMVLVDLDRSALEEDQLFAVGWFGELAVKRLRRAETGAVEVVSDNPTHPTRTVRDEGDGFRIVGRVVWLAREV